MSSVEANDESAPQPIAGGYRDRSGQDPDSVREARAEAAAERTQAANQRAEAAKQRRAEPARPPAAEPAPRVVVGQSPQVAADNTDINERDTNGRTLTPTDQGGSEGDRKITQRIRQAVVGDDSLSFTAKNVKIITIDGKVTLRGPVKSDQERATIGAAAKQVAGAQVDNQLEVAK